MESALSENTTVIGYCRECGTLDQKYVAVKAADLAKIDQRYQMPVGVCATHQKAVTA